MKGCPLPPISVTNTALVIHDMQNDFIGAALEKPEMAEVVGKVRSLIDLAHTIPIPVIYTRFEMDPALMYPADRVQYLRYSGPASPLICAKGTPGAEVVDVLKPQDQDFVITKVRSSAFYSTNMESLLRTKGIWILIAVGGSTSWGVEWLARDSNVRDITTVAVRDCTYSATPEAQAASLENIDTFIGHVMDYDQVVSALKGSKLK